MKTRAIFFLAIALFLISADGCETTAINKLYPNPVDNELHVELNTEFLQEPFEVDYQVTNMSGQIVQSGLLESNENSINCSELTPGYYVITLVNYGKSARFVKK